METIYELKVISAKIGQRVYLVNDDMLVMYFQMFNVSPFARAMIMGRLAVGVSQCIDHNDFSVVITPPLPIKTPTPGKKNRVGEGCESGFFL